MWHIEIQHDFGLGHVALLKVRKSCSFPRVGRKSFKWNKVQVHLHFRLSSTMTNSQAWSSPAEPSRRRHHFMSHKDRPCYSSFDSAEHIDGAIALWLWSKEKTESRTDTWYTVFQVPSNHTTPQQENPEHAHAVRDCTVKRQMALHYCFYCRTCSLIQRTKPGRQILL